MYWVPRMSMISEAASLRCGVLHTSRLSECCMPDHGSGGEARLEDKPLQVVQRRSNVFDLHIQLTCYLADIPNIVGHSDCA